MPVSESELPTPSEPVKKNSKRSRAIELDADQPKVKVAKLAPVDYPLKRYYRFRARLGRITFKPVLMTCVETSDGLTSKHVEAEQARGNAAMTREIIGIKDVLEAILFAAQKPLSIKQLQQILGEEQAFSRDELETALVAIIADYQHKPLELKLVASGYRFQVRSAFSPWVGRLFEEKPTKYSRALLETLAIIAYRQPVTRGDIEDIRGVSVSSAIIQTLLEREWIKVIGHKEVPGRPALLGTTRQFLDYFNLKSLDELPALLPFDKKLDFTI